jgi:hypothetical protein
MNKLASSEIIEQKIFLIRGQKVILDSDLAELYHVDTKRLNEQVKRNIQRFPDDFMFRLTKEEYMSLRSQVATLKNSRDRHRKYLPYAFTEHGAIMAAGVLTSEQAISISIYVVRAFVRLRQFLSSHKELSHKLSELERKIEKHDTEIQALFEAIRQLMAPTPEKPKPRIGFHA